MRAIDELYEILWSLAGSDAKIIETIKDGYSENDLLGLSARILAEHMGLSRKKFYDLMKASKLYHMHNAHTIASTFYELMDEEDTNE